jgi:hypothetical protein
MEPHADGTLYRDPSVPGFYQEITYDALAGHSTSTYDIQTYTTKHHTVSYNTKVRTTKDTPTSIMAENKVPTKNCRAGFSWTNCKTGCQRLPIKCILKRRTRTCCRMQSYLCSQSSSTEILSKARRIRSQKGCPLPGKGFVQTSRSRVLARRNSRSRDRVSLGSLPQV